MTKIESAYNHGYKDGFTQGKQEALRIIAEIHMKSINPPLLLKSPWGKGVGETVFGYDIGRGESFTELCHIGEPKQTKLDPAPAFYEAIMELEPPTTMVDYYRILMGGLLNEKDRQDG